MELNRKIESITMKTTSYFSFGEKQNLNNYDRQIIEYYQEILNLIIEIAKREEIKNVEIIDNKYFEVVNTASMMIEEYLSILQFYGNIDRNITKREIDVINQIQENLKLDDDLEIKNKIELADCYFKTGNENKARKLILEFIKNSGYDRLVKFYDSVGDFKNKEKYQELYDSWKKKRETIEF